MKKHDFIMIEKTIDKNNSKEVFNYALIDFDNMLITATDTRRAIVFHLDKEEVIKCRGKYLAHKSTIKQIAQLCEKDAQYRFENNHIVLNGVKISLDNNKEAQEFYKIAHKFSTMSFEKSFNVNDLMYIDFDLTHKNTHINSDNLKLVQEHGHANYYEIHINEQKKSEEVGEVRIIGHLIKSDTVTVTRFAYVIMGVPYKPQIKGLFD